MKYEFLAKLNEDLTLTLPGGGPMQRALAPLTREGVEVIVTVEKFFRQRTSAQNRYIHGVVVPVVKRWHKDTTGEVISHDATYYFLRSLLGDTIKIIEIAGNQVMTLEGKRFSQMNTQEFGEAIDRIQQELAPKGCYIPNPTRDNFLNDFV